MCFGDVAEIEDLARQAGAVVLVQPAGQLRAVDRVLGQRDQRLIRAICLEVDEQVHVGEPQDVRETPSARRRAAAHVRDDLEHLLDFHVAVDAIDPRRGCAQTDIGDARPRRRLQRQREAAVFAAHDHHTIQRGVGQAALAGVIDPDEVLAFDRRHLVRELAPHPRDTLERHTRGRRDHLLIGRDLGEATDRRVQWRTELAAANPHAHAMDRNLQRDRADDVHRAREAPGRLTS